MLMLISKTLGILYLSIQLLKYNTYRNYVVERQYEMEGFCQSLLEKE